MGEVLNPHLSGQHLTALLLCAPSGGGEVYRATIGHCLGIRGKPRSLGRQLLRAWKHDRVGHGFNAAAATYASYGAGLSIVEARGGADIRFSRTGAVGGVYGHQPKM